MNLRLSTLKFDNHFSFWALNSCSTMNAFYNTMRMDEISYIWFFCLKSKSTHLIETKKKWNKKKITRKIMISKISFRNVNEMLLIHAMKFERCNQTRKCKHLLVFIHYLRNQNCFVMWNCSCKENAAKLIISSSI